MFKRFIRVSLFISFSILSINSCNKVEEENEEINLTNGRTTAIFNPDVTYGTMTDQDGNIYKTVTIGTQTWMAENLRTTKYNDGTPIPKVTNESEWFNIETGAYCNYNNTNDIDSIATFGRLYNWYSVETGKLAPNGWHVPSDAEWTTLATYLGGEDVAGGKLKEIGTTHWISPNGGATNETGFTALPGGRRGFSSIGSHSHWWSSTEGYILGDITMGAYSRYIDKLNDNLEGGGDGRFNVWFGYSIRCVKD